jgi:nitric oxide reductase subunit B
VSVLIPGRSAEFLQQPLMQTLVWLRIRGNLLFGVGVIALAWFVFRRFLGPRETSPAEAHLPVAEA